MIYTGNGNSLYLEPHFHTFFKSSPLAVLEAEYDFNRGLAQGYHLGTLADFYQQLGLDIPPGAGDVGWNEYYLAQDWSSIWVDFIHRPYMMEDGTPYCEISYAQEPKPMDYMENYYG